MHATPDASRCKNGNTFKEKETERHEVQVKSIDIPMAEFNKFPSSLAFIRIVRFDSKEETEA